MNQPVQSVLTDKGERIHGISPDATVQEAVSKLNKEGVGALVVMQGKALVGIFTERDLLRRVVEKGLDITTTLIRDVMTERVLAVGPDTTVEEAMAIMTEKRIRHLPVMAGDRIIGLVSIGDLTRVQIQNHEFHLEQLVRYISNTYPG